MSTIIIRHDPGLDNETAYLRDLINAMHNQESITLILANDCYQELAQFASEIEFERQDTLVGHSFGCSHTCSNNPSKIYKSEYPVIVQITKK